ncbi:hypothetical protein M9H77_35471 [Catharanthus roseus]|uniref:Uncharacterized protein n=1 Tax=Catharanthus roseus TaxID=4058 RepID=A0ACB9ZRN4_CATRO|nr:hypothetical protein M9H77_35471 [Catharanthus roseus]
MSNDNIGNVDDDMVEESHVRRMKKDAYYWDIRSGGHGIHLDLPPIAELHWQAIVEDGAVGAETSSSGDCLTKEEDCSRLHKSGPRYSNGPSYFPNLTADQCPARRSPTRQRKEKPTQPNRTVQAPDSSNPAPPTLARASTPNPPGPRLQTRPSDPLSDDEA